MADLLTALVYVLKVRRGGIYRLKQTSVCILLTASMYIASKILSESVDPVSVWADASGFQCSTVIDAERKVLTALRWRVFATCDDIAAALSSESHMNDEIDSQRPHPNVQDV